MPYLRLLLLAALAIAAGTRLSLAQNCSFTVSNVSFGVVDTLAGGQVNTTATVNATCTGLTLSRILICPNLGAGSGGATPAARLMVSGGSVLAYQLYSDAARSTVWGSYLWAYAARPPSLSLTLGVLGGGSANYTLYAAMPGGQTTVAAGTHLSSFAGADVEFRYRYSLGNDCSVLSGSVERPGFNISATVASNCLVSTQDVDFGTQGVLGTNVDATGRVSVTCTPGNSYSVGLDGGASGGPPTARLMTKGAETVTYGLYQDAARSLPWGSGSVPGEAVAGTGTGTSQDITVYGRVPPQATPSPGTYADTVVVTVTY
nr:spore coat protein U domain-containing protein [Nitratireductor pacificus]